MKEGYINLQEDKYNIIGSKVIDIGKSNIDGRKVIIMKNRHGELFHIESPRGTKLTMCSKFKLKSYHNENEGE